jgi:uncharacterized protein (DUF2147 family)
MQIHLARIFVAALLTCFASIALAQSPVGTWKTIDDNTAAAKSYVKIHEQNGKLFGKVTKLLIDPADSKCEACTGDKKDKPILGMVILTDMEKDDDEWVDGRILDPENGEDYSCKIWFEDDDFNTLYVRGYWGFFYRTQEWYRLP